MTGKYDREVGCKRLNNSWNFYRRELSLLQENIIMDYKKNTRKNYEKKQKFCSSPTLKLWNLPTFMSSSKLRGLTTGA